MLFMTKKIWIIPLIMMLLLTPFVSAVSEAEIELAGTLPSAKSSFQYMKWRGELFIEKTDLFITGLYNKQKRKQKSFKYLEERVAEMIVLEGLEESQVVAEEVDKFAEAEGFTKEELEERNVFTVLSNVETKLRERGLKSADAIKTNIERIRTRSKAISDIKRGGNK